MLSLHKAKSYSRYRLQPKLKVSLPLGSLFLPPGNWANHPSYVFLEHWALSTLNT